MIGAAVYTTDANQNGANSVLERSLVQEPFGRMYIGGIANSIARGNYIRRTALSGIFLYDSTTPGDPPTTPLTNITLSNNVIDGTNMVPSWWWFQFGGISSVTLTTAYDLMTGSPFSNLNITDNFIADSGRSGVWLGNTNGGSITGNYLLNPNARPDVANAYPGRPGDALRPLVVDTTSIGITTANNTIDTSSGVTFVTDTAYRELAAYAPGGTMRLNAYNIGALVSPTA